MRTGTPLRNTSAGFVARRSSAFMGEPVRPPRHGHSSASGLASGPDALPEPSISFGARPVFLRWRWSPSKYRVVQVIERPLLCT